MSEWRDTGQRAPFSATDAAFAGFRLVGSDPGSVVAWGLLALLVGAVMFGIVILGMGPFLQEAIHAQANGGAVDPEQIRAMNLRMAPLNLLSLAVSLLFYPVIISAVYRAILRPRSGFGHFRLGKTELLQLLVLVVVGASVGALYIAGLIALAVGVGLVGATASKAAAVWTAVLGGLALAALLIFLLVRLSFVGPSAFDTGRFSLSDSWRLTRRRFWPLLGAYLLAWVLACVAAIAVMVLFVAVAALIASASPGGLRGALAAGASPGALLIGLGVLYLVVISALNGVLYGVIFGVAADAYRQIRTGAEPGGSHAFGAPSSPPTDQAPAIVSPLT